MGGFTPCATFPKQRWICWLFLLFLSARQPLQPFYFGGLTIHNMLGDYRVPLETRKRPKMMSKILWEELEVLSLRFQNPAVRSVCVPGLFQRL